MSSERAVILCKGKVIELGDIPLYQEKTVVSQELSGKPLQVLIDQVERQIIVSHAGINGWRQRKSR